MMTIVLRTEYKQASTKMVSSRLIFFQQDYTDNALPAEGRVLTRKVVYTELGKPLSFLACGVSQPQGKLNGVRV